MPDWTDDERVASAPPPPKEGLKRWWPLLLAAVLAAGLYAWLGRSTATGDVLHVGSQRGGTKPLMLASGALDGAPYRVEWSELPTAQNLPEAIGAGAVDVGMVGDAPFQFAYQSGSPIKAVAVQSATSRPRESLAILVPARSRIVDAGGLRGKRVATTRGSVDHYLLLGTLDAKGLKPSDVRLIFLAPGDAKAAFDTGSIDAWSIWSPYSWTALAEGARVVADGADVGDAARFEHYDDSAGNTVRGKVSTRYEITPCFAIRGGVNTGFRAPSLAQTGFSITQNTTAMIGNTPVSTIAKFLRVNSAEAIALGSQPLEPEKSLKHIAEITYEAGALHITLDAHQIRVDDRIVKAEFLGTASNGSTAIRNILIASGVTSVNSVQFSPNAIDTRTRSIAVSRNTRGAQLASAFPQHSVR